MKTMIEAPVVMKSILHCGTLWMNLDLALSTQMILPLLRPCCSMFHLVFPFQSCGLWETWHMEVWIRKNNEENFDLFYLYTEIFASNFWCVKKRFGFCFEQSQNWNEFLTCEKVISSNHKSLFKRIVFLPSSRVALLGSFDKIIFSMYSSCS